MLVSDLVNSPAKRYVGGMPRAITASKSWATSTTVLGQGVAGAHYDLATGTRLLGLRGSQNHPQFKKGTVYRPFRPARTRSSHSFISIPPSEKQPSCKSRHRCDRTPMFPCLRHAVEHGQQLPHAGGESQFLRLPGRQKPLVELSNDWVSACRHQGSHVQHGPHSGPSTPGSTPPSVASAISTEWGHADQSCDLLPA